MKRRTFLVCTAALFCGALLAGGCTQKTSQPVLQQIEYSNLADSDTQALLSKLLQDAGVSDLRIQTFFDHVQKFNNAVDPAWLTTGFENAKPSDLKYDPYSMQDAWTEKYDTFPGWNCRITACGLFGDFITVTGKADLDSAEDTLFMDYETLDSDPESLCGDERQKFDALFAPVKTTNTTDIPTHLKTIQQEWKKRGLSFVGMPSTKEENAKTTEAGALVQELSRQKAVDIWEQLSGGQGQNPDADQEQISEETQEPNLNGKQQPELLVVGADTVVCCEGKILGKPHSREAAAEMLTALQGRSHEVYTGVTLYSQSETVTFFECTQVEFYPMTEVEISEYIDSKEPMDKAGAYGIQGLGARFVKGISGDYNNVVGLPVGRLYQELKSHGWM